MSGSVFLSYARKDDETFVKRLYHDLIRAGFEVWFDRVAMPSRGLTFTQEIRDAIAAHSRLLLAIGPYAAQSDYVIYEWQTALEMGKVINPVIRLDGQHQDGSTKDGYSLIPEDLRLLHAEDFRSDDSYPEHFANLIRQLSEPVPPLGKLVAVPNLPSPFIAQPEALPLLRNMFLQDIKRPILVTGAAMKVGLEGMGGIGKTVLATAIARDIEIRRAFSDGIFWVNMGQSPNLVALQRQLVADLGSEILFENIHTGLEFIRKLLESQATLLILDNVWRRVDVEAFNALGPRCKMLITTRDAGLVGALAGAEYKVQLPNDSDALQLFAGKVGVSADDLPSVAMTIIRACGRLPLAISLAGGMIRSGIRWDDLLDALQERDLDFWFDEHAVENHHKSLWLVLDASVRALPSETRLRLYELAVFPVDMKFPEEAAVTFWTYTGSMLPREARRLVVEFGQRSLIELILSVNSTGLASRFIFLHDLLQMFISKKAAQHFARPKDLEQKLLQAYRQRCKNGWASGPNDGYFLENICGLLVSTGHFQQLSELLTNIEFLQRTAERIGASSVGTGWRITQFLKGCLSDIPRELIMSIRELHNMHQQIDAVGAALELRFVRGCGRLDKEAKCKSCGAIGIYHGHIDLGAIDFYDSYYSLCTSCLSAWHDEEYSGFESDPGIRKFSYVTNTYASQ